MGQVVSIIRLLYWTLFASPERYARHIGVTVGENCFIDTRQWSSEPYLITIGNHVQIARGVSVHTHGGGNAIRWKDPDFDIFGKVRIDDWAYIGSFSQILPGVTIGEGAIVAAGSVVTKSVAPHTVVAGNPAQFICTTDEYYERNKPYDTGTGRLSKKEKQKKLLSLEEHFFIKK